MGCRLAEVCVAREAEIASLRIPVHILWLPGAGKNSWGPGWDLEGTNCWQMARVGRVLERWSPRPGGTDKRALSVAVPRWSLVPPWSPLPTPRGWRRPATCHSPRACRLASRHPWWGPAGARAEGRGWRPSSVKWACLLFASVNL